jgi:formylglycine-generating enzyme required for sulfatase activity
MQSETGGRHMINETDFVLVPYKKPFYMQKTVVTQEQWAEVMGSPGPKEPNLPVTEVSWNDARWFIEKLNKQTGKKYRLPTNKEWVFACGEDPENLDDYAWNVGNSNNRLHQIAQKLPNDYGLYDMLGNIWEWVGNKSGKDSYSLRGGAWLNIPENVRAAIRYRNVPAFRNYYFGFRLSLSAPRLCPHCRKEI